GVLFLCPPYPQPVPPPRHHTGLRVFWSTPNTSTRPGPEGTAHTPTAGMTTPGIGGSGTGRAQVAPSSDQRQTAPSVPTANVSMRLGAEEQALGGPASLTRGS